MSANQRADFHVLAMAFTFWAGFTFALLWRPHLARVAMGSAFIVVVLLATYTVRWVGQHRRGDPSDADGATWRSLIAFFYLGITAWIINGGAWLCNLASDPPESNPTTLGGILIAEVFALMWTLASVCWGCVLVYLGYHRAWSAAGVAAAAVFLGMLGGAVNLLWLWQ